MRRRRKTVLFFVLGCTCGIVVEYFLNRKTESVASTKNAEETHQYNIQRGAIYNDLKVLYRDNSDAAKLATEVRVLCWVLTHRDTLHTKARAVKETWGKRCNVVLFFSSEADETFPAISLDVTEGYDNLWLKTRAAWKYVYDNHKNEASWFIKADDDTFMIMENMRNFLSNHKPTGSHFFGRNLWKQSLDYNSGGAGYVFSKETLRKFVTFSSQCQDASSSKAEDIAVAKCLKRIGITPGETRDANGKETFHPFAPDFHLIPNAIEKDNWLYKQNKWEVVTGPGCCSERSIAFHYTTPKRMYLLNYYVYVLRKGGVLKSNSSFDDNN